jgi:hypothetical protein
MIVLLFLLLVAVAGTAGLVWRRRRAERRSRMYGARGWPLPPLVFPSRPLQTGQPEGSPTAAAWNPHPADMAASSQVTEPVGTTDTIPAPLVTGETEIGEPVAAGPIHFHRPPDGTLQLLPGRLQIVSGGEEQEEIRFVRVSGRETAVTFGRSRGEPHLHVQLRSRTVSRQHASLSFHDGRWSVMNLSHTNPVVLNGRQLPATDAAPVVLEDGDQIEMGEVVFRFRAR